MKNSVFTVVVSAALLAACALFLPPERSYAADAAKGKQVYDTYCALCHGPGGKGDGPGAAALDPKPRDLSSAEIMQGKTDESLVNVIANGGAAGGLSAAMPPWSGVISAEDIQNVVAHIRQNLCECQYKK